MAHETDVNTATKYLIDNADFKPKSKIKNRLQECCKIIQTACESGLEKHDINKLAKEVVFPKNYDLTTRRRLLYCLIPKTDDFPYEIIPIAVSSMKQINQKSSWYIAVLQWLGALLEHRIIDSNHRILHICYTPIFTMLGQVTTCAYAVKVLHYITQIDDIISSRVQYLVKLGKKIETKDYVSHLQGLYRIYRPDLIAFEIRSKRNLPKGSNLLYDLAVAARHRLDQQDEVQSGQDRAWPEMDLSSKLNPWKRPNAVPHPEINIYAERLEDRKREQIFTTHYKNYQDYIDNIESWDKWRWPNNSASHLSYPAIIPLFRPHHMHVSVEIINWLQYALKYEVLEPVGEISSSRANKLLSSTISLVRHTQSTNPAVFHFLTEFLALWDGNSFADKILDLVSWMPYTSGYVFFESVMHVLSGIMVRAELNHWCAIVNALGNLMLTWAIQAHTQNNNDWLFEEYILGPLDGLWFLTMQLERNFLAALQQYNFHPRVLNKILDYYVKLDVVVTELNLPMFFFPPAPFTLSILAQGDLVASHRIAQLLINMKHQVQRVSQLKTKSNQAFIQNECLVKVQDINESIKILMNGSLSKAFHKDWMVSLLQFLDESVVSALAQQPGIKRSLGVVRMLNYIPCVSQALATGQYDSENKEKRLELQETVFTDLDNHKLSGIKTFLKSYKTEPSSKSMSSPHEDSSS